VQCSNILSNILGCYQSPSRQHNQLINALIAAIFQIARKIWLSMPDHSTMPTNWQHMEEHFPWLSQEYKPPSEEHPICDA